MRDLYELKAPNIEFGTEARAKEYERITGEIERRYETLAEPEADPVSAAREAKKIAAEIEELNKELLSIPEVQEKFKEVITNLAAREVRTRKQKDLDKTLTNREELINTIKKMQVEATSKLLLAEQDTVASTNEARKLLEAGKGYSMALAAQGLVQAMENTIQGFKKTEMMFYEKLKSDIEGPFARVGKPGYRTEFEERRRVEEEKGMRPMSMEEYQAREKELIKIEFDEKEARIKQAQDKEVAALRAQQAQAEKMRDVLADAMLKGDLAPETQGLAKRFFDSLTGQLAESEQAKIGPKGEITFKGVPAIEESRRLLAQIQQQAKDQAQKAERAFQAELNKTTITDPITGAINLGTAATRQGLADVVSSLGGQPGPAAAPALGAAVLGTAATGVVAPGAAAQTLAQQHIAQTAAATAQVTAPATEMEQTFRRVIEGMMTQLLSMPMGPEREALNKQIEEMMHMDYEGYGPAAPRSLDPADARYLGDELASSIMTSMREATGEEAGLAQGLVEAVVKGAKLIAAPTGFFGAEERRPTGIGGDPLNLTRRLAEMQRGGLPTVGASNYNLEQRRLNRQFAGFDDATSGSELGRGRRGDTPGSFNAPGGTRDQPEPAGVTAAQAEATQSLTSAVESLQTTLSSLAEQGIQLPADVTTSLTTIGDTVSNALTGQTLDVNITNANVPVTVGNIADIGTAATAGAGAQITELGLLIQSVEDNAFTEIDTQLTTLRAEIEDEIAAIEFPEDVTDRLDTVEESVRDFDTRLDEDEINVDVALERLGQLENELTGPAGANARITVIGNRVGDAEGDISEINTAVEEIERRLREVNQRAESANSQAQSALNMSIVAKRT